MNFDVEWFLNLFPLVLPYVQLTLWISVLSLVLTIILSALIAIVRYYQVPILAPASTLFITLFRATPLVAQLFILYFGFPRLFESLQGMSAFQATVIALTLNTTAFMSENFRAALEAVEKGQIEACYSMGFSKTQTMLRTILPQSFMIAIPSVGNHFIGIIKGSALGFTVGLMDIMAAAKVEAALSLRFFEAYLCVTLIYLVLVMVMERAQKWLENKIKRSF